MGTRRARGEVQIALRRHLVFQADLSQSHDAMLAPSCPQPPDTAPERRLGHYIAPPTGHRRTTSPSRRVPPCVAGFLGSDAVQREKVLRPVVRQISEARDALGGKHPRCRSTDLRQGPVVRHRRSFLRQHGRRCEQRSTTSTPERSMSWAFPARSPRDPSCRTARPRRRRSGGSPPPSYSGARCRLQPTEAKGGSEIATY
jgi:hypothetical protein